MDTPKKFHQNDFWMLLLFGWLPQALASRSKAFLTNSNSTQNIVQPAMLLGKMLTIEISKLSP